MPRRKIIRTSQYPYHVTSRSNNKEWFYIPIKDVWTYFNKHLRAGQKEYKVSVHAKVLMSNHYHILLSTPESNIDAFMRFFNQSLGKSISRQAGRVNRIFGAPYKWSLIQRESYYLNVVRYIYQNPLRAGIVKKCEDYKYSDFKEKISNYQKEWINKAPSIYEDIATRKNLRRYEIK